MQSIPKKMFKLGTSYAMIIPKKFIEENQINTNQKYHISLTLATEQKEGEPIEQQAAEPNHT